MTGPVAWVSPEQLAAHKDRSAGEGGDYLPTRLTRDGLFTQPLYAAPQPAPAIDLGQFREAVASLKTMRDDFGMVHIRDLGAAVDRVLDLIDGQMGAFNGDVLPDDLVVDGWPRQTGWELRTPRGIKLTHKPTGTVVTCDTERSQHANRDRALEMLRAKLQSAKGDEQHPPQHYGFNCAGQVRPAPSFTKGEGVAGG